MRSHSASGILGSTSIRVLDVSDMYVRRSMRQPGAEMKRIVFEGSHVLEERAEGPHNVNVASAVSSKILIFTSSFAPPFLLVTGSSCQNRQLGREKENRTFFAGTNAFDADKHSTINNVVATIHEAFQCHQSRQWLTLAITKRRLA